MTAQVVTFSPGAALTVEIKYLHHTKRHHRDSDERRALKARASFTARTQERTFVLAYERTVDRWTALDLTQVVDLVRATMPTSAPDGLTLNILSDPTDRYVGDGRALQHIVLEGGWRQAGPTYAIWFSTAARPTTKGGA